MIDAKWLFSWKSDELDWIRKTKSRLVARGFEQRDGICFGEAFAPTVSSSCVRLLSTIACKLDLDVCHFDVCMVITYSRVRINRVKLPILLVVS